MLPRPRDAPREPPLCSLLPIPRLLTSGQCVLRHHGWPAWSHRPYCAGFGGRVTGGVGLTKSWAGSSDPALHTPCVGGVHVWALLGGARSLDKAFCHQPRRPEKYLGSGTPHNWSLLARDTQRTNRPGCCDLRPEGPSMAKLVGLAAPSGAPGQLEGIRLHSLHLSYTLLKQTHVWL